MSSSEVDGGGDVLAELRLSLDEITALTRATFATTACDTHTIEYGLKEERMTRVVISGSHESVDQARIRLLVLLDERAGLHTDAIELDYKMHAVLAGREGVVVQKIQEETATSIYFPTPFMGVLGGRIDAGMVRPGLVMIAGDIAGVLRAKELLFQCSMSKVRSCPSLLSLCLTFLQSQCIFSRATAIIPRKLDWLLAHRRHQLRRIARDNATFIQLPILGSQASLVTVYGDSRVNIERTLRAVTELVRSSSPARTLADVRRRASSSRRTSGSCLATCSWDPSSTPAKSCRASRRRRVSRSSLREAASRCTGWRRRCGLLCDWCSSSSASKYVPSPLSAADDLALPIFAPLPDRATERASRVFDGQEARQAEQNRKGSDGRSDPARAAQRAELHDPA